MNRKGSSQPRDVFLGCFERDGAKSSDFSAEKSRPHKIHRAAASATQKIFAPAGTIFFACIILFGTGTAHAQSLPDDISSYLGIGTGNALQASTPPSPVDLLYESDSYVPPFYRGRALPSAGTELHFEAIAHFTDADGDPIPDPEITYTWKRNGEMQGQVSGLGASSVVLAAPSLFGQDTIEVDAQSADDSAYGSASVTVSAVDPGVTLYQDHPLLGIEYYNAVQNGLTIPDLEMTFAGVPYFAQAQSPDDSAFSWNWTVNGETVPATTTSASELTINAAGSSGQAAIAVSLTSSDNLLLDAQNAWNVVFSRTGTQTGQ